jgi:hypothetical protein
MGQWAGAVRIVRSWVWGRPYLRLSPITGAGLDPRVCDPSGTPAGIPSNGSDGEGCWGGEAAGTDANGGVVSVRVVAVPEGGAGVVRIVDPRAAAQQLGDPPSTATYARIRGGWVERQQKSFEAPAAPSRSSQQPASQQPGQNQTALAARLPRSGRAKGPRAQGPRREPGGEKQPGRTPTPVPTESGRSPSRKAARAPCGSSSHEPPRSSM